MERAVAVNNRALEMSRRIQDLDIANPDALPATVR